MVTRRSLSSGGSFGRASVIYDWTVDNWSIFDGWCCARNIDPIELPAYRFYNVALVAIKEYLTDPDPEVTVKQLMNLEEVLDKCDEIKHPLQELYLRTQRINSDENKPAPEPSKPEEKYKYVPKWWIGEDKAYKIAQSAMGGLSSLPKMS